MGDKNASLRAQLLATEHWSLLASRSSTQSEMLSRIGMFLTLVSAGLVSLALVGQATKFSDAFAVFAITVLGVTVVIGVLTQLRVINIAMEDLMYVLAMNRLRAAYVELDAAIEPYLMASRFDDFSGVQQTYYFLTPKRNLSQVLGSSLVFIMSVNSVLIGLLAAVIAGLAGATTVASAIIGGVIGVLFFAVGFLIGERKFSQTQKTYEPYSRTPPAPPGDPEPTHGE